MNNQMQGGLQPLPKDKRDFGLGIFKLPKLDILPKTFEHQILGIKNQGQTDFCSAYTTSLLSELQECEELFAPYSFALSKKLSGNPDDWGQNMRYAFKAHVKYGAIATKEVSDSVKARDSLSLRHFNTYPGDYADLAKKHLKKSYFKVTGRYDYFDNIRAAIWYFREEKQGVGIGLSFDWSPKQYVLDTIEEKGYGHMMAATGWTKQGLIVSNSYGLEAGIKGKHIITRKVINHYAKTYGTMMMVDMDPEEVKKIIVHQYSFWKKIIIKFKKYF